ncbi:porin family protein [Pedobacter sp. Du54]|uniref:porin family protein n=1 Tax=Pedobacter anseongensis TaxID=3133439 RepID=UPI00309E0945
MKKLAIIGLGIALTFSNLTLKAQTMDTKFGIKAGANLSMMGKYDFLGTTYTSKYVPGWQAGFYLDLPLSEKLSFMPEVLYSQKSGKVEATVGATTGEIKLRTGYIDVPVLLSFNATPQFSLLFGPQASFLVNQSTKIYANGQLNTSTTDKDNFRPSIAGGIVGLGYKFTPNVNLNARYSMDFQAIAKDDINQDKARFSGFALSLGFGF